MKKGYTHRIRFSGFLLALTVVLYMCCVNAVTVTAADNARWVIDDADIISDSEEEKLQEICEKIYQTHGISTVVVTTRKYDGSDMETWQDALYETQTFGKAASANSLIFGISMAERDWQFTVYGKALDIFNAYVRENVASDVIPYFSDGEYYRGFAKYLERSDYFMSEAEKGNYYSASEPYKAPVPVAPIILVSFILSLIGSLAVVSGWKRGMDTKIRQTGATNYMKKDSFHLRRRQDLFLYYQVSRTRRERENRSDSHHGNMHSSGHGTGGKF